MRPDPAHPELEPKYLASLIDQTEARIAAGETDLISEVDPADEPNLERGEDLEDYYGFEAAGSDLDEVKDADRCRGEELNFDESEGRPARAPPRPATNSPTGTAAAPPMSAPPATPPDPSQRLDDAATLEADCARRDVADQETRRHAAPERHTDLDAEYAAEPPAP